MEKLRKIAALFYATPKHKRRYEFSYDTTKHTIIVKLTEDETDPWILPSKVQHAYEAKNRIYLWIVCESAAGEIKHKIGETDSNYCGDARVVADAMDAIIAEFTDCLGFVEEQGAG